MPAIEVGRTIGREFVVERPLSSGGMGAVFVAVQTSTGVRRALKLMRPELVRDPRLRERFVQEARVSGSIPSDHVVQVITAGIDYDTSIPFLVMELLDGDELATAIQTQGPVDLQTFGAIFQQLCHAVGAAHEAGIVHRDLKPENIFLARSRIVGAPFVVKVLDFGIAKLVAEARAHTTESMGTPLWMAPEQTARGSSVSPQTDVWAIGLIAFFCLTGRTYWSSADDEHPSLERILREMLVDDLIPASKRAGELGRSLPKWFDGWFTQCVHREPTSRFPDAKTAWDELARCIRSQPPGAATEPMLFSPVHDTADPRVPATLPWAVDHQGVQSSSVVTARDHVVAGSKLLSRPRGDTTSLTAASDRKSSARKPLPWVLAAIAVIAAGSATLAILTPSTSNTASQNSEQRVSHVTSSDSDSEPDSNAIESRVHAWNAAHASQDDLAFASLYSDSVLYYGRQQTGDACVKGKRAFLKKNVDFRQDITGPIRTAAQGDGMRADFLKRVSLHGKLTEYPSYLVFRRFDTGWRIVTEGDTVTDANLARKAVTFTTRKSATRLFSSLIASVEGREYVLIPESDEACLTIEAQKDFDGNGTTDALVRHVLSCGGNGTGDSFFFSSYAGNGHFERSDEFGYSWTEPMLETWKGRWSVLVTSNNEGINQLAPEETTERFVLDSGKAISVAKSKREALSAESELKSDTFDMDKSDERHSIVSDLDGDGVSDKITGRLWQRWGRILWTLEFANGKTYESHTGCKRIGVLRTRTNGVLDLVCDQDGVLRWNGSGYDEPD